MLREASYIEIQEFVGFDGLISGGGPTSEFWIAPDVGQVAKLTLADLDSFGFEGRLGLYRDATLSIDSDEPLANVSRIIFEGFDDETSVEFPTLEISGSVDFPSINLEINGPVSAVIDVVGPDSVASF